jgi:hypothetical protein
MTEKIKNQNFIDFDDVKDICFRTTLLQSQKLLWCFHKIALSLDVDVDLKKIQDSLESDNNEGINIPQVAVKVFNTFMFNAYIQEGDNFKLNPLLDELITILSSITKFSKEILLDSHQEVLLEILLRVYFGYRNEANKSFLSSRLVKGLAPHFMKFIPLLNGMNRENLNIQSE